MRSLIISLSAVLILVSLFAATAVAETVRKPESVVGIAQGEDYAAVTAQAIRNAGGLGEIIRPGNTVLLKPNLCTDDYVDRPTTTDYRVVAVIVDEVRKLGAGRIIIAEGPFGPEPFTERNLRRSRYNTIEGVEFIAFNATAVEDCYYVTASNSLTNKPIYVPKIYVNADVLITVPVMKTHDTAMVSLGLKNALGAPPVPMYNRPRSKQAFHNEFNLNDVIVELNLIRTPDFVVVDGIVAGEGHGPTRCTPVKANTVIAGRDIVAVDAVGATFMGFTPEKIPYLSLAAKAGLGEIDLEKITVNGGNLTEIALDFESIYPKK